MTDLTTRFPVLGQLARLRPAWWWAAPVLVLAVGLYYLIGLWVVNVIDDTPDFAPGVVSASQSRAVAVAAALIHREVDVHDWSPNDPFFQPGFLLKDMPNFQVGITSAIGRFCAVLAAQQPEPGVMPPDLPMAAGLLKYPPNIWRFNPSASWIPTTTTEKQYRRAAYALEGYNGHLDSGMLSLDRGRDALAAFTVDVAADLGAVAQDIQGHMEENHWALSDVGADDLFYLTKGRLYAYSLLLRELGQDYARTLSDRGAADQWRHMVETLRTAAAMRPAVVMGGGASPGLLANHLAVQGFYVLRIRQQLGEIASALGK